MFGFYKAKQGLQIYLDVADDWDMRQLWVPSWLYQLLAVTNTGVQSGQLQFLQLQNRCNYHLGTVMRIKRDDMHKAFKKGIWLMVGVQ